MHCHSFHNSATTQLFCLFSSQWRGCVEGPITPGTSSESILEEHADDGHHCQSAVSNLGRKLFGLLRRITGSQHLEAIVTWSSGFVIREAAAEFTEAEVGSNLSPTKTR